MSGIFPYTALSFSFVIRTIIFCSGLFLICLPGYAIGQEVTSEDGIAIYGDRIVGQQFQYPMSNLDRIGIRINISDQPNTTDLLLTLKKSVMADRVILEQRIPLSSILTGDVFWFEFMPLGDDEDPTYYLQIASPQSIESNAPLLQTTYIGDAATIGPALLNGQEQEQSLQIVLQYDRSLWTRIEYVLARFEIDKPWFYNRYVYAIMFVGYLILLAGFVVYTYKIIVSSDEARASGKFNTFLYLIVFVFLVRGVLYSSIFPAWQAPDEPAHFALIKYMSEHDRQLPQVEDAAIQRDILISMDQTDYALIYRGGRPRPDWQFWVIDSRDKEIRDYKMYMGTTEGPLLFYFVASIPYSLIMNTDTTTQLFLMRLLMVMWSCGVIIISFKVGRHLYPDNPLPVITTSCLCFYPVFLHMGSIVSYDVLVNLLSALLIFYLVKTFEPDITWFSVILVGTVLGTALYTKAAALMLLPGIILWGVLNGVKFQQWRDITLKGSVILLIAFCIGGWWYANNLWHSQNLIDIISPSWHKNVETNEGLGLATKETLGWNRSYTVLENYWEAFQKSFIGLSGNFGWGNLPLKSWMYVFTGILFFGAIIGVGKTLIDIVKIPIRVCINQHSTHLLFYGTCICYCLLLFIEQGHSVIGRYYFPVLIPGVYLFIIGILKLFPAARKPLYSWGLIVVFIVFDSLVLLETIIPRYYLIPPPSRILDYIP